jgi:hypothetical protein
MKKLTFVVIFVGFLFISKAQITKGNWMVGGNASYSSTKYKNGNEIQKTFILNISPDVGYFFANRFAAGLRPEFYYWKGTTSSGSTEARIFRAGPFARYYFLSEEKTLNLLLEGAYQYSITKTNASTVKSNTFSFFGGPVIYFNTSVGMEFLIGYSTSSILISNEKENTIRFRIGIQFHLEK